MVCLNCGQEREASERVIPTTDGQAGKQTSSWLNSKPKIGFEGAS